MAVVKLSAEELKRVKRDVLKDQLSYLCEELGDPGRYFPFLKSKDVLSQAESEAIRSKTTTQEKVEEFVKVIGDRRESKKGEPVFDVFVEGLKRQKVQAHIARALQRTFARKKAEKEREKRIEEGDGKATQHTSGSQPGLQTPGLQTPIQATSNSRSSTPNHETNHIGSQGNTLISTNGFDCHPEHGVIPNVPKHIEEKSTNGFDCHPEHGAIPNVPKHIEEKMEARKRGSPTPPSDNMHPLHGLLPPTMPPSSSSTNDTGSLQESDSTRPDQFETGMGTNFNKSPPFILYAPEEEPSLGYAPSPQFDFPSGAPNESPQTEQKYRANLRQQTIPSPRRLSDEMNGDGRAGTLEQRVDMLERAKCDLGKEVEYLTILLHQRDSEMTALSSEKSRVDIEVSNLKMENVQLRRQLAEVKDYDELQKELQQVKEKLRHVTLSYHEHSYESIRRSNSDLDDYAQLQDESSKLLKQVEEHKSRIDSMEREKKELKSQVDEYQKSNQVLEQKLYTLQFSSSMQARPHNLPINHMMGRHSSYGQDIPTFSETPSSFTPPRSMHVGDHLSRHNIHLQHSGAAPLDKRHSASSGELTPGADSTSLRSSNTSLSSHGSTVSKTSLQLNHSATSTTLV